MGCEAAVLGLVRIKEQRQPEPTQPAQDLGISVLGSAGSDRAPLGFQPYLLEQRHFDKGILARTDFCLKSLGH